MKKKYSKLFVLFAEIARFYCTTLELLFLMCLLFWYYIIIAYICTYKPNARELKLGRIKLQYRELLYLLYWKDYLFHFSHKGIVFSFSVRSFYISIADAQLMVSKDQEVFFFLLRVQKQEALSSIMRFSWWVLFCVFITPESKQVSEEMRSDWCMNDYCEDFTFTEVV